MTRRIALAACTAIGVAVAAGPAAAGSLTFGAFGAVALYGNQTNPKAVVLFVSGDGGWNEGVVDMAGHLAGMDALVLGIDITRYLKNAQTAAGSCLYSAADFEALSQYAQKKLGLARYTPPVLVGYSSGATLVYAIVAQAPPGTFQGAVSLGFCPDLPLTKPLCKGSGLTWGPGPKGKGYSFEPRRDLAEPWAVLQGTIDQVCDPPATKAFVDAVGRGMLYLLPKVGHGYSVPRNWLPQFKDAFSKVAAADPPAAAPRRPVAEGAPATGDLPLIDVAPEGPVSPRVAVVLSGDGGWAGLDREVAGALAAEGVRVVGWNSLEYYWTPRTPDGAAADLARILERERFESPAARFVLIGYSLGADVLPFLAARLPPELRARIDLVALIGPSETVSFEFHVTDWLGGEGDRKVLPEVGRLRGLKVLCLYGDEEKGSICPRLDPAAATVRPLGGGHHFGGDYRAVAREILEAAGPPAKP